MRSLFKYEERYQLFISIIYININYFKVNNATRGPLQVMVKVEFLALLENFPMLLFNSFVYFYVDYEFTGMNLLFKFWYNGKIKCICLSNNIDD